MVLCIGKRQISTPLEAKTPEPILMKLGMVDYVWDPTRHTYPILSLALSSPIVQITADMPIYNINIGLTLLCQLHWVVGSGKSPDNLFN